MPREGLGRGPQLGVLLLLYQLCAHIGLSSIPPITLGAIGVQISLYLEAIDLGWRNLPISAICLSGQSIIQRQEFFRIWTSQLTHGSDIHLYYNMLSLAWKGIALERRYGSFNFAFLLVMYTMATGFVYAFLSEVAATFLHDASYLKECPVGFSGVLFALKVLVNHHQHPDALEDFGFFSVPKKMAVWAELLLIQLLVPNASLLGHLAGIVVGVVTLQAFAAFHLIRTSVHWVLRTPATFLLSGLLTGLHFDLIPKPWRHQHFWSSRSSLVCLSASKVVWDREFTRLMSAPFEHASNIHFLICLVSLVLKLHQLERVLRWPRLLPTFVLSLIGTSVTFVIVSLAASMKPESIHGFECVQGLSGTLFALKVLLLWNIDSWSLRSPLFLFEVIEMSILCEPHTLLFHISGIIVGILLAVSRQRFPGVGFVLGGSRSQSGFEPWTRSWGYGRRPRPVYSSPRQSEPLHDNMSSNRNAGQHSTHPAQSHGGGDGPFPPPPAQGGFFYAGDSQSESSLSPNPLDLDEVRRRRLLRFS